MAGTAVSNSGNPLVDSLSNAIATFEGYYNSTSNPSQANNNPGNLTAGAGQVGTSSQGFAVFPDAETGMAALNNQVELNIDRGLSLQTFIGGGTTNEGTNYPGYASAAAGNNVSNYVNYLASQLGIDPNTPLSSISPGDFRQVLPRIPGAAEPKATPEPA